MANIIKQPNKYIILLTTFLFLINLAIFNIALAETPTPTPTPATTSAPASIKLQIPILMQTETSNVYEYIGNIYTAALYIIVPITILIIIMAGLQWASSAGNSEQIKAAKNLIIRGFIGLGIALLSYSILSLIGITSLSLPGVEKIEMVGPDEFMDFISESQGTATTSYGSVGGQCFPVAANSFSKISWNWGARRSGGDRCHAGIDIYTKSPGHVVAIADGTVTSVGHFYSCGSGWSGPGSVDRIFINHGNFTVNYGEIDTGKVAAGIKAGTQVKAGQVLGVAGHCGMLHMEIYQGNVSSNARWYPPSGRDVGSGNYCRDNFMSTKPAQLMDLESGLKRQ